MDEQRFDDLVRQLRDARTRRSALAGLIALGVAAAMATPDDASAKGCGRGKRRCGRRCIPRSACCTNANCGPNGSCVNRVCVPAVTTPPPGTTTTPLPGTTTTTTTTTQAPTTPPPDRCGGPVGICNADPTPCGRSATGETCGCERAVEGNNFCANAGDGVCGQRTECTSTSGPEATSCRNLVGFHFFCQEAKRNTSGQFCGCGFGTATGRVCVPECDNPSRASSGNRRSARARGKQRRARKAAKR